MSRVGTNPLKWIGINKKPEKITIVTIVHIPELSGFWENSLDVLKLSINSLHENTTQPFDLMVLDNGSCKNVKEFLYNYYFENKIQYLTFSKYNLRKIGAMDYLFSVAPGEIISFTDSDVYFKKGWLEATMKIFNIFPEAGMVSAIPTIDKSIEFYNNTHQGIKNDKKIIVQKGENLIPENYIEAHRISLGKNREKYMENIKNRIDTKITLDGINAYVCAQDFQFTTKKEIVDKVLPLIVTDKKEYYDPIYSPVFESKIDGLGYWRLSTEKYLIHHIGNDLDNLETELSLIKNPSEEKISIKDENKIRLDSYRVRFIKHPFIRKILKIVYRKIYKILYEI
tara:strand:+ start:13864 stop:14883 length:1020 start_codon:yes stop_codon:yes gene_type:complete